MHNPYLFRRWRYVFASIIFAFSIASYAKGNVIDHADVNGFKTFQDTNTGFVWLDMDNFFDSATGTSSFTPNDMIAAATNAGFTFATKTNVEALLNTLPLTGGAWFSYAPIMGFGAPRELIWGGYDDEDSSNPFLGWAFAFSTDSAWGFADNILDPYLVAAGNPPGAQDLGLWAYVPASSVPEGGATILLLGVSLGLLVLGRNVLRRHS